ncbi:MAG: 5-formyltetrahydrofolate cyclo-ligase [Azonexus sp.]
MNSRDENNTAWRRALRQEMAARRVALADAEHAALSARIVEHARAALARPKIAAFCWPIKHEPDVRTLLESWRAAGVRAALPVVIAEHEALRFREWTPETPLAADRYGIPTPSAGDWLIPDLILLPLNGFDAAGYRLGYGGGYFDRTLAALTPRPLAVGVGFETNRVASIRPQPHDQHLDWIITENGAFRPTA